MNRHLPTAQEAAENLRRFADSLNPQELSQQYELVMVKRERVPEWLYRALCVTMRPMISRWPLRNLLHRPLNRQEMIDGNDG